MWDPQPLPSSWADGWPPWKVSGLADALTRTHFKGLAAFQDSKLHAQGPFKQLGFKVIKAAFPVMSSSGLKATSQGPWNFEDHRVRGLESKGVCSPENLGLWAWRLRTSARQAQTLRVRGPPSQPPSLPVQGPPRGRRT